MDLQRLRQIKEQQAQDQKDLANRNQGAVANIELQETIVKSIASLVRFLDGKTTKTEVVNQLDSIATPDVDKVVQALKALDQTVVASRVDLSPLKELLEKVEAELKAIPKDLPVLETKDELKVSNFAELDEALTAIKEAVQALELNVEAPIVNVPKTTVNVDAPDLSPIKDGLTTLSTESKNVVKAVKGIKLPELKTDPIEKLLKKTNNILQEISDAPSGGGGYGGSSWVAVNTSGIPMPIQLTAAGAVPVDIQDTALTNMETYLNNRFGGGKTSVPFTVTTIGDTTIHTPATGYAVRLYSIKAITDPDETATPLIKVLIGSTEKLRGHALGEWEILEGAANEVLKINLSAASSVSGTAFIKEFIP